MENGQQDRRSQVLVILQFTMPSANDFAKRSDQWDIRLNVPDQEWCEIFVLQMEEYCDNGQVKYLHVSNIEIGDVPGRSSYGEKHIHIALVLNNPTSKRSIYNKFAQKGRGWYIEPRDKTKPVAGWIAYHSKTRTKIDPSLPILFKFGTPPRDRTKRETPDSLTPSEQAKMKRRKDEWSRKKYLMNTNQWEQLDNEFPGFIYSSMGQSMKREVMKQSNDEYTQPLVGKLKNFIIWGPSGSGKSSSVAMLYPECYKKQKGSQYWDAYDKTNPNHRVVWIDEMSKETLKTFSGKQDGGFEFLKELADRYPVTVDEKYTKGYKIRPHTIIITMNEHPTSLLPDRAVEVNKQALFRKFKILYVDVRTPFI